MWDRRWVPVSAPMYEPIVYKPFYLSWFPFYSESMGGSRSVKTKINVAWCPSISVVILYPLIAWVVEDICQEVVRVLGAIYTVGNNTMLPGRVVAEADQTEFLPYAFMKMDDL